MTFWSNFLFAYSLLPPTKPKNYSNLYCPPIIDRDKQNATLSKPLRTLDHVTEDFRGLSLSQSIIGGDQ